MAIKGPSLNGSAVSEATEPLEVPGGITQAPETNCGNLMSSGNVGERLNVGVCDSNAGQSDTGEGRDESMAPPPSSW